MKRTLLGVITFLQVFAGNVIAQTNVYPPDVKMSTTHNTRCSTSPNYINAQDNIMNMIQTSDGGYVGVGFSWIGGDQDGGCHIMNSGSCIQNLPRTPYIVKMSASGNVTAEFKYNTGCPGVGGANANGVFWSVIETSDGYVAAGEGANGMIVMKITKDLSTVSSNTVSPNLGAYNMKRLWKVTYPDPTKPTTGKLEVNGFIIAGIAYTGTNQYHDTYILHLNEDLTHDWEKPIDLDHWSRAFSVAPLYRFGTDINGMPLPNPNGATSTDYGPLSQDIITGFALAGEYVNLATSKAMIINVSNNATKDIAWQSLLQSTVNSTGAGFFTSTTLTSTLSNSYQRLNPVHINCDDKDYDHSEPDHPEVFSLEQNSASQMGGYEPTTPKDVGKCIIQTSHGDIVLCAEFHLFPLGCNENSCYGTEYKDAETVLIKFNQATGDIIPVSTANVAIEVAHSSGPDFEEKVKETVDGGFIVGSTSADIGNTPITATIPAGPTTVIPDIIRDRTDQAEMVLYKVDQDFNPEWTVPIPSNYYFSSSQAGLYSLEFTSDGGYIVGGFNINNNQDLAAAKLLNCQGGVTPTYSFSQYTGNYTKDGTETDPTSPHYDAAYRALVAQGKPAIVKGTWNIQSDVTYKNYTLYFMDTKATTKPQSSSPGEGTGIFIHNNTSGGAAGRLTLENCILRGLNAKGMTGACADDPDNLNDMWDGIVVEGNSSFSQSNFPDPQGELLLDGTTIREARTGVSLGPTPIEAKYNQGGGSIASGNGSQFINCRFGVRFFAYRILSPPGTPNSSTFNQTTFLCTGPLKGYLGEGTKTYLDLNQVDLFNSITGCTFQNSGSGYRCGYTCTGINAFATNLFINFPGVSGLKSGPVCPPNIGALPNIFRNLDFGVFMDNVDPSNGNYNASIYLNQFYDVRQCITAVNFANDVVGAPFPDAEFNYFNYGDVLPSNALGTSMFGDCEPSGPYKGIEFDNCASFIASHNRLSIMPNIQHTYSIDAILVSGSGKSSITPSSIYFNEFKNQSPATGTPYLSGSTGAYSTGIKVVGNNGDNIAKFIDIYGNGSDYQNPGQPNSNLKNYIDWDIQDLGFTITPCAHNPARMNFGMNNFFSANSLTSNIFHISSSSPFTYYLNNSFNPATGENTVNTKCLNVTPNPGNLDYNFSGNSWFEPQYCLNPTVMPLAPGVLKEKTNAIDNISLDIMPNPASSLATIKYNIPGNSASEMQIIDALGRNVSTLMLEASSNEAVLNVQSLKPGVYYYQVSNLNKQILNGKFVVVKP